MRRKLRNTSGWNALNAKRHSAVWRTQGCIIRLSMKILPVTLCVAKGSSSHRKRSTITVASTRIPESTSKWKKYSYKKTLSNILLPSSRCSLCDMIYSSAVRLETHRIAKHNSNGNQSSSIYECRPCDRTFTTSIELTCHEISHTLSATTTGGGDQPPARQLDEDTIVRMYVSRICELCGHLMDTFTDALHHHRVVHQQTGYLTCCGKRYFKKFRLLQHCQWHADPRKFEWVARKRIIKVYLWNVSDSWLFFFGSSRRLVWSLLRFCILLQSEKWILKHKLENIIG